MKKYLLAVALLGATTGALAQISARIDIGQPGFYGRIDAGDYRPQLIYERPVIIQRRSNYIAEPVYLRVPPGHRKNWRKHCNRYNACGREVLFVSDDWYSNTYAPRYREQHGQGRHQQRSYAAPRAAHHDDRGYDKHDKRHDKHDKHDKFDKHGGGNGKHGGGNGKGHGRD